MTNRKFCDFAIAYALYSRMEKGKTEKAATFARTLGVAYHAIVRVTAQLAKAGLITSRRGYATGGITRVSDAPISDVFTMYGVAYDDGPEMELRVKEALKSVRFIPEKCDVCEVDLTESSIGKLCAECDELTKEPSVERLAKCGHPSLDRYFACIKCQPMLPSEDPTFEGI